MDKKLEKVFEQILNEEQDWFEDIGESFDNFAESISNAAIGEESLSLNEARIGNPNYITYLLRAEESYFHIKTQLEISNKRNTIEKRNNLPNDERPFIRADSAPSVCMIINTSTDRMRRLNHYLNSEDNEFKKAILLAAITIYRKMLNALRVSLDLYNRSANATIPIPEEF
jgi:hypothetical protein